MNLGFRVQRASPSRKKRWINGSLSSFSFAASYTLTLHWLQALSHVYQFIVCPWIRWAESRISSWTCVRRHFLTVPLSNWSINRLRLKICVNVSQGQSIKQNNKCEWSDVTQNVRTTLKESRKCVTVYILLTYYRFLTNLNCVYHMIVIYSRIKKLQADKRNHAYQ